ncbi:MAG: hypothetical protein P4L82_22505 [Ancalomicrobiaceae bacterium]|nr:hypothetical protein [Ancalomicrobiaceae bacterium]
MIPPGIWTPKAPNLAMRKSLPAQPEAAKGIFLRTSPELQMSRSVGSLALRLNSAMARPSEREGLRGGLEVLKDVAGAGGGLGDLGKRAGKIASEAGKGLRALQMMPIHLAAIRQLQLDQASLKAQLQVAQMGANGGSDAAQAATVFLQPMLDESEYALAHETGIFYQYESIYGEFGAVSESSAGKLAVQAEKIMGGSKVGRALMNAGDVLSSDGVANSLIALGALTTAWQAYDKSPAQSQGGKLGYATVSGGAAALVDLALKDYPVVALADTALKYGGKYVGIKDPEKYTIGRWAQGTINQYVYIGRAIWMWDSAPLNELQRQNMSGENGAIIQGYSMIGEKLGEALYPAVSKIVDWANDVSERHTKSQSWWNTVKP